MRRLALIGVLPPGDERRTILEKLAETAQANREAWGLERVVLGYNFLKGQERRIEALRALGLDVRDTKFASQPASFYTRFFGFTSSDPAWRHSPQLARPMDVLHGYDFLDCDGWLLSNLPDMAPLAPMRPYGVHVEGSFLAGRLAPQRDLNGTKSKEDLVVDPFKGSYWAAIHHQVTSLRAAAVVFAASQQVLDDTASYAGLEPQRLQKIPRYVADGFGHYGPRPSQLNRPYFVLWAPPSLSSRFDEMTEIIRQYILVQGGTLDIAVLGPWLTRADVNTARVVHALGLLRDMLPKTHRKRIHYLAGLDGKTRTGLLQDAQFVLNCTAQDMAPNAFLISGAAGVPLVTSYSRELEEMLGEQAYPVQFIDVREGAQVAATLAAMPTREGTGGQVAQPASQATATTSAAALGELLRRLSAEPAALPPGLADLVGTALKGVRA